MTYRESQEALARWANLPTQTQLQNRDKIMEAFRVFWVGCRNEAEFAVITHGLFLLPEMLYFMVRGNEGAYRRWRRGV